MIGAVSVQIDGVDGAFAAVAVGDHGEIEGVVSLLPPSAGDGGIAEIGGTAGGSGIPEICPLVEEEPGGGRLDLRKMGDFLFIP